MHDVEAGAVTAHQNASTPKPFRCAIAAVGVEGWAGQCFRTVIPALISLKRSDCHE